MSKFHHNASYFLLVLTFKDTVQCKKDESTFSALNLTACLTSPTSPNMNTNRRRNKGGHGKGGSPETRAREEGTPSLGPTGGKEGRKKILSNKI